MPDIDKLARQLSSGARIAQDFERRYGLHALIRERQELLRAFEPPRYITEMMRIQDTIRAAFVNPFEEMMRSIRPSLDDFRLRAGLNLTTLSSIRGIAESLSRPSEIMRQVSAFEGLRYSAMAELMQSQSALAEAALGIRKKMTGFNLPDLFPHDRIAGALAGIKVLSDQNEAMRLTATTALESIQGYQAFAERQLHRAKTDNPVVFSRRMAVTDLAGDLLETTQSSWELLGLQALVVLEEQSPELFKPSIYSHLNRELAYLYREAVMTDPGPAFDRSTASAVATLGGEIVELMCSINETRTSSGNTQIITPTNRALRAVHQLTASVSTDERSFGEVVDALYCLLYEGSGYAARLTELMTDEDLAALWWVKTLRTSIRHDVDHGNRRKSERKHVEIGDVYYGLVGHRRPKRAADWSAAQVALFERTADLLRRVLDVVDPSEN